MILDLFWDVLSQVHRQDPGDRSADPKHNLVCFMLHVLMYLFFTYTDKGNATVTYFLKFMSIYGIACPARQGLVYGIFCACF